MREVVECIIYNKNGEVLMQKKTSDAPFFPNGWLLFGGAKEDGEDSDEAITRELNEELGSIPYFHPKRYQWSIDKKNKKKVYTYQAILADISLINLTEGAGFAFFNLREIKKLKTFPRIIRLLEVWRKEWKNQ